MRLISALVGDQLPNHGDALVVVEPEIGQRDDQFLARRRRMQQIAQHPGAIDLSHLRDAVEAGGDLGRRRGLAVTRRLARRPLDPHLATGPGEDDRRARGPGLH
jgi:hypothetical protein